MNFSMPVSPSYGNGGGGFGWGGDWAWIIILLLAFNGGWGGGFGGGYGNLSYDFPWLLNGQNAINANTNSGFDHAATQTAISGLQSAVTSGFGDVATQLCGGFAGVNATVNGAQNAIAQQMYTNQIADLQQSFALQSQLAQCCCDNRAATQDLKYTLATEACATRSANTQNTQAILDKLCQLELSAKDDTIAQLRSQVNELSRSASQTAQTAAIIANNEAQTAALEMYLNPPARPAYVVANPNCCYNPCGTNCGCGA